MLARLALLIAAFGVVPALCAPGYAAAADRLPALPNAVVGQAAGIRVIIEPDAWTRNPPDLERWVTPLRLTIDNESSHPLRLRFEELVLTDGSLVLRPVAPHVLARRLAENDSSTAPPPAQPVPAAPSSPPASSPATSPASPRSDVMTVGLREGVVAPGDRAWGFLYYERGDAPLESLRFELRLVDSRTGEQFGTLRVPLGRG